MATADISGVIHEIKQPVPVSYGQGKQTTKQTIIIREPATGQGKDQYIELEAFGDTVSQLANIQPYANVHCKISIRGGLSTPSQQYPEMKAFNRLNIVEIFVQGQQNNQQQPPYNQNQAPQQQYQQNAGGYQQNQNQGQQQPPFPQQLQRPPAMPNQQHPMARTPQQQMPGYQQQGQQQRPQPGPGTFEAPNTNNYANEPLQDDIPF